MAHLTRILYSFKTAEYGCDEQEEEAAISDARASHTELAAHASALAEAVSAGGTVPAGRLFGLPELAGNDYWLDMAGATAITGIPPKTISSWLARGGPARNPFPVPQRLLYRLHWRGTDITSWQAREIAAGRPSPGPGRRPRDAPSKRS